MKFVYKNSKGYIYKRRIPTTDKFYIFNLRTRNYKVASKISIVFNKLSFDIFTYIKMQGKRMFLDMQEVTNILDKYRDKALEEYQELEKQRHKHLENLFSIKEEDPIMGTIKLNGANPKVIEPALNSFMNLSVCDFTANKKAMLKVGKDLVKRSTPEIKNLFSKLRNDEENLLTFLSLLFKVESEVLKIDYQRAQNRFNPNVQIAENTPIQNKTKESFTKSSKIEHELLENVIDSYLFEHCGYKRSDLKKSQSQVSKTSKIVNLVYDYIKYNCTNTKAKNLNFKNLKEIFSIVKDIPKKQGNHSQKYDFYSEYRKMLNKNYERRTQKTITTDLQALKRFVEYLMLKQYITNEIYNDLLVHYDNEKKAINRAVTLEEIQSSSDCEAYKLDMLKKIFSLDNPYYQKIVPALLNEVKLREDQNIDIYSARFYVPLILFFSGARVGEMSYIKTEDCEIRTYPDGIERILIYVISNEQRSIKTQKSRRIILLHDFLTHDLDFISFVKKAQKKKRKYLFYTDRNISTIVSKEFNRPNVKEVCVNPFYTKEDEFKKAKYTLHSLRHNYKTNLVYQGINLSLVNKIQGHKEKGADKIYISFDTEQIVTQINTFNLYTSIQWDKFKEVAMFINK